MFNIKGSRCYYSSHHHHCHNPQLKAVAFVGTVGTVGVAVTRIILVDNISHLCTSNSPLDTRTPLNSKQLAFFIATVFVFIFTLIHLCLHCIRLLSSFSFIFIITASHHFITFTHRKAGFTRLQKFATFQKLHIFANFWKNRRLYAVRTVASRCRFFFFFSLNYILYAQDGTFYCFLCTSFTR